MSNNSQRAPEISVVIPAYNAEKFILNAVESVLAQTFRDFELIVVNDGSTDQTQRLLSGYTNEIKIVSKENGGLSAARNTGIATASGKWVAFLDADDRWHPEKLQKQFEVVKGQGEVGFCSTRAVLVDEHGERIGEWGCPEKNGSMLHAIFERNATIPGSGSGVIVRRDLFDKSGLFDSNLQSLEDIDMWMRLAALTNYICVDEPLTFITRHSASMSTNIVKMHDSAKAVMKKNRHLLPAEDRGRLWRYCFAGMQIDYAKWAARSGHPFKAISCLIDAILKSPSGRGKLALSVALSMLLRKPI